jgi:hypothetical protein
MTAPLHFACRLACLMALGLAVAACASKPASEVPASTTAPAAKPAAAAAVEEADEPPMERSEAAGQCWMRYDKSGGSLEAKAALVEKCINDKMKKGR